MAELFDLSGKVALIVGGAGGIGRALAMGLANAGADIAVASRSLAKLEDVAGEVKAIGRKSLAVAVDITNEKSVMDMVQSVLGEFPKIDILINSAGAGAREPAENFPIDEWQKLIDVHTTGTFLCCREVGREMIKHKSGKIINISSIRGRYGLKGGYTAICASKGAVDTMTRNLACEWASHNVLVNAIAPTVVDNGHANERFKGEFGKMMLGRIPLGRWATPADIVGPAIFLASSASDFVTGQILYVDGGVTTW